MKVTIEDAYREAVTALGEAVVKERLLSARMTELEAAIKELAPVDPAAAPVAPPG